MLTINHRKLLYYKGVGNGPTEYIEGECLSTDTKPLKYANGSKLLEMDTGTLFVYDDENKAWRAWA